MRTILCLCLSLLVLGGCDVDNDTRNDQVRLDYDQQRIEKAAADAARAAKGAASSVGNVATTTGRAIKNEVGDIDVDVDVKRTRRDEAN